MTKLCHHDGSPCRSDCDQYGECHAELTPTLEHLSDPYVLQLIQAISERDDTIEALLELLKDTPHDWLKKRLKEIIG